MAEPASESSFATLLEHEDVAVIGECLRASADGPFFDDWEFQTLFGLEREEVSRIASVWPSVTDADSAGVAINNSLNNLTGISDLSNHPQWSKWVSVTPEEVRGVYRRYCLACQKGRGGVQ